MDDIKVCRACINQDNCTDTCNGLSMLRKLVYTTDKERKYELLKQYKDELELAYAEPSPEMEALAERIIAKREELHFIKDYEIHVGYVRSTEAKRGKKVTYADCRKLNEIFKAYLPFDYIITFYADAEMLTENQQIILMLHELKHIDVGPKGLTIRPHDIEDFEDILMQYGINWNNYGADVPNILDCDDY
jgi:predicted metallopeptidase